MAVKLNTDMEDIGARRLKSATHRRPSCSCDVATALYNVECPPTLLCSTVVAKVVSELSFYANTKSKVCTSVVLSLPSISNACLIIS